MKQQLASHIGSRSLALLGVACAFGLSSCSDESSPGWWKSLWGSSEQKDAPAVEEAAAPSVSAASSNQKEVLDYMVFTVGQRVRQLAANPLWREEVREMRNRLETYYNTLSDSAEDKTTKVKLGLFLADAARDLTAYNKALEGYTATLKDWEALPEAERNSIPGRRTRSAIANGMGSCYLAQNKAAEALTHYEQAMEIDKAIFDELAPADDAPLPTGSALSADLARAAEDVLSSYRCLGECQFAADDPEEARDTYKSGQDLAMRMKHMPMSASLQLIRLLSSLGNLESNCGRYLHAAQAWVTARNYAQQIAKNPNTPAAGQAQAARFFRELDGSLKSIAPQLEAAKKAAEGDAAPQQ